MLLVITASPVLGQPERAAEVVSSGVTEASSSAVALNGTAGQAAVFATSGTSTAVNPGFWPAVYLSDQTATAEPDSPAEELPTEYELQPAYPNPFNPVTRIPYTLPEPAEVRITVYDALGQRVASLVERRQQAGRHEVVFRAGELPSGPYYYRMQAGSYREVRAVTLLK